MFQGAVRARERRYPIGSLIGALVFLMAARAISDRAHVTVGTMLTPAQKTGLAEVTAFVEAVARACRVQPPAIMVADHAGDATVGAVYRRGVVVFTSGVLTSPSRDEIAAHELAHYVFRHDQPSARSPEEIEHQANIEAVRILQVGKGMSEEAAVRQVLVALDRSRRAVTSGSPIARGHAHPCEEIRAVAAAYPAQRAWTAPLECASAQ
jgi:hypothetical protein